MEQRSFYLPTMNTYQQAQTAAYALRALPGVVDVLASAVLHQLVVQYDESRISPTLITQELTGLGFMPLAPGDQTAELGTLAVSDQG
jgi:allophanate hydrolase subunit 1